MEIALFVVGGVVLAVLAIVVITQRQRIASIEADFGLDGVGLSVKLHEMVKREVARVSLASLGRLARIDRELIEYWEKEKFLQPEDGAKRLALLDTEVTEIERKLSSAEPEDRVHLATQLRELYWKYLQHARAYWASSEGYQTIRRRVIEGLNRIEEMGQNSDAQPCGKPDLAHKAAQSRLP